MEQTRALILRFESLELVGVSFGEIDGTYKDSNFSSDSMNDCDTDIEDFND